MPYWAVQGLEASGSSARRFISIVRNLSTLAIPLGVYPGIRGKIGSSGGPGQSCQWNPATGQAEKPPHEGHIGSGFLADLAIEWYAFISMFLYHCTSIRIALFLGMQLFCCAAFRGMKSDC